MFICFRWQFLQLQRNIRSTCVLQNLLPKSSSCHLYYSTTAKIIDIKDENIRVLFLGNDNFSVSCLRAIEEVTDSKKCLSVVVSSPNNIVGKYATKNSMSKFLWEELKAKDNADVFDIGIVASFGHLIPKRIIEKCNLGILNVHGSLLPKYRGAAPISRAICNGDTETGVSIMKIAPHKFDVGPILIRRKCKIHPHIRSPELAKVMAEVGGQVLKQVLLNLKHSLDIEEPQQNEEATFAPKLTPELSQVNWEVLTALEVYNLFRGLAGFFKLSTYYGGKKIDLDGIGLVFPGQADHIDDQECNRNETITENTDFSRFYSFPVTATISSSHKLWSELSIPGQFSVYKNLVVVCCADKQCVFVRRVKLGSKWMAAKDFQNGYVSKSKGLHMFLFNMDDSSTAHAIKAK